MGCAVGETGGGEVCVFVFPAILYTQKKILRRQDVSLSLGENSNGNSHRIDGESPSSGIGKGKAKTFEKPQN